MYTPADTRYDTMSYPRLGRSGLGISALALGLWHNFGDTAPFETMRQMCFTAFDHGVTHFDLANNYGPEQILDNLKALDNTAFTPEELEAIDRAAGF